MKKTVFYLIAPIIISLLSCSQNADKCQEYIHTDTIYVEKLVFVHDTVIKVEHRIVKAEDEDSGWKLLAPPMADSATTHRELDKSLITGYMNLEPIRTVSPEPFLRNDLYYLPYLVMTFIAPEVVPFYSGRLVYNLAGLCFNAIDDHALYNLGKMLISKANPVIRSNAEIPEGFVDELTWSRINQESYKLTRIDTLAVRTIAHNDRDALGELEKYYRDKGDAKSVAIYYKVLLGYEGNGDLAERFYKVLEPYFDKTPEFRRAVRETLLRAALCDHNERAQQLCDSLGFSLCDYRLPVPSEE